VKKFGFLAFAALLLAVPAQAQSLKMQPSTPDMSVTGTATAHFNIIGHLGVAAQWFAIKNDCTQPLYFDLRDQRDGAAVQRGLKLKAGESFSMRAQLNALVASPDSDGGAACTFTLMLAVE